MLAFVFQAAEMIEAPVRHSAFVPSPHAMESAQSFGQILGSIFYWGGILIGVWISAYKSWRTNRTTEKIKEEVSYNGGKGGEKGTSKELIRDAWQESKATNDFLERHDARLEANENNVEDLKRHLYRCIVHAADGDLMTAPITAEAREYLKNNPPLNPITNMKDYYEHVIDRRTREAAENKISDDEEL